MATGDHGNARCAARSEPASASWSHSPEGEPGEAAAARAAGRPAAGARSGRLRVGRERKGGGLGLASVLPPPRVSASVRQSVLPPAAPPSAAPLSPASRRLRLSNGAEPVPTPPANRRASPRRRRTPPHGAARQVPARKGDSGQDPPSPAWAGPAWTDGLRAGAPRTGWTRRKGGSGDGGRPAAPTQTPGRPRPWVPK